MRRLWENYKSLVDRLANRGKMGTCEACGKKNVDTKLVMVKGWYGHMVDLCLGCYLKAKELEK